MRLNAARLIDAGVFFSLLALIALAAIPYGTVEPWWIAAFQCLVFFLAALSVFERWLSRDPPATAGGTDKTFARYSPPTADRALSTVHGGHPPATAGGTDKTSAHYSPPAADRPLPTAHRSLPTLFWPALALIAFALIQTFPWSNSSVAETANVPRTLSADPFQTRLFVIQFGVLLLVGWMLMRYTVSQTRVRRLVEVIIAVGVVSASFGLWRQARQHQVGFILPNLRPGFGYGQFVNSNHFAFLMEMVLGLTLGRVICRGVSGRRLAGYLICAVPMFVALVLSNSRGGILSILCQAIFLAWLFVSRSAQVSEANGKRSTVSRSRQVVLRALLVAMLLVGAVVTVVFVGGDPLVGRLDTISVELDRKTADTFALRQSIWRATWRLIKEHPVAGVGFGGYWVAITKYHQASGETTPQQAHNDYLELLASGGVIGVLLVVWFVVAFVRSARRTLQSADPFRREMALAAIAGILAVAVHSLVDFGLHITINALVFAVLLTLVVSSGQWAVSSGR